MSRKKACSVHYLARIPAHNCLAHCLTKSTAKADNLIEAVKTVRLLEVDIHPNFRTLMEHKALLSTGCRTFMRTREKDVFFLSALKISFAPTPRERSVHVIDVSDNSHAAKIVCTCRFTNILLSNDSVIFGEDIVFVFGSYDHSVSVSPFFLQAL